MIARLDLADCANCYTSKCSNGQRKRLSIAIELCFNSDLLILDEPTSGLDAVTGFQIMNTLKALTKRVGWEFGKCFGNSFLSGWKIKTLSKKQKKLFRKGCAVCFCKQIFFVKQFFLFTESLDVVDLIIF